MRYAFNLLLAAGLLSLVSCATKVRTLGTRMVSPETQGKLGAGSFDFRYSGLQHSRMDFHGDSVTNPLLDDHVSHRIGMEGELGLLPQVDVFIIPAILAPTLYGIKVQLLGDHRLSAKRGNFSLSLAGSFGQNDLSEEQDGVFGRVERIEVKHRQGELGLLLGYRWFDKVLNYASAYHFDAKAEGKVSTRDTLVDAPFVFNQEGQLYSYGFIFYVDKIQYKLDYSYMVSTWSRSETLHTNTLNFSLGITF